MKTLYSGYYKSNGYPFAHLADEVQLARAPSDLVEEDSALVIWGGSDINPALYGHPPSSHTWDGGERDKTEWELMSEASAMGIPIIGVCRGAQMLCALAGGFLIQDVNNHQGGNHSITTVNGDRMRVNSIHHQMMFMPEGVDQELLAWSTINMGAPYIYKDDKVFTPPEGFKEPELVYFPRVNGLAIQWHPEAMHGASEATQFIYSQMRKLGW